ncbi:hypothetical protein H0A36_09030 [Endozoicomonas sp. SM1973]|uniref:Uncharacterized protein n=1 Tax=Spartinivicinus marinus TaxID=2994442 RepID=A0A853IA74_9GAMM|nr:hypothetical protein [Spartinivicinus marinus]MCX4028169.1 hypothetical protein [Spartinivicinus marinus]NYZ66155.1 hypothetical protein [Spartinivicinus marinus]
MAQNINDLSSLTSSEQLKSTYGVSISKSNSNSFPWKVSGGPLEQTMHFTNLDDAQTALQKGYKRSRAKHLTWLFRKLRGRNGHNVSPIASGESGPVLVIDGGDDLAVSLENSGLPRKLVQTVQALGLYPGFIAVVHKGWLGALEERNEASEAFAELKDNISELKEELTKTLQTELLAKEQQLTSDHPPSVDSLVKQLRFKKALFKQFNQLKLSDDTEISDAVTQVRKLIDTISEHRVTIEQQLANSDSNNSNENINQLLKALDNANLFDPKSPDTQTLLQKIAELRGAQEEKWLKFIESRLAGNFTESGLGSMYWGMISFETRATSQLLIGENTIPYGQVISTIGDTFNVIGQAQMVVAGLAKAGLGIQEVKTLNEWLGTLRNNELINASPELRQVKGIINQFYTNQRNAHIVDIFGNIVLTAGQLGMILGGPYGIGVSAILFAGVGATIGGVGFTQAIAQYMSRRFDIIETPTKAEKAILSSEGNSDDSLRQLLVDRVSNLYQFSKDQAPARVWQKIYRQLLKNPHYSAERILNKLERQFASGDDHYRRLYREALSDIRAQPDQLKLLDTAVQLVKSQDVDDQWQLFSQISEHLRSIKTGSPYTQSSGRIQDRIITLIEAADALGFGPELDRRFITRLVNNPNYFKRHKIDVSRYISEITTVKSKKPWNIPNPLRPVVHVVELIRGPNANPLKPLFKISWGHKKTKILTFHRERFLADLASNEQFSDTSKTLLGALFHHKEGLANLFGRDKRSIFAAALNSVGKRILRSDVLRPLMVGVKSQVELSELLRPALDAENSAATKLNLTSTELEHAFLTAATKNLENGLEFATNQAKLTILSALPTEIDGESQQRTAFSEQIKTISVNSINELANGTNISPLIATLQSFSGNKQTLLYRLQFKNQQFALVQQKNQLTLYHADTAKAYQLPTIKSLRLLFKELNIDTKQWQLTEVQTDLTTNNRAVDEISAPIIPTWQRLVEADNLFGRVSVADISLSRVDLWTLGLSQNGQRLTGQQIAELTNLEPLLIKQQLSLDANHIYHWLKTVDGDQAYQALLLVQRLQQTGEHPLNFSGDHDAQQILQQRLTTVANLETSEPKLTILNKQLEQTLKTLTEVDQNQRSLYGNSQQHGSKLAPIARNISRINMGLQLARLPGSIYQTLAAAKSGNYYDAAKEGLGSTTDVLDISLDLIANSQRIQSLSSKLANTAGKLGAAMNFIGAGLGTWYAVDSFKAASQTTGAERTDHLVAGSLAIAGTIVSIATGIASLITVTAGPIGAAIGLAISIAQGIYNAVRATNNLRAAGISEGDLWRAGAAVFFGFPVPEDIQNQAAYNQTWKVYQQQIDQQFQTLTESGIDKLVYSQGHIETHYGKVFGGVTGRHDYHNLSPKQRKEYDKHVPPHSPGHVFGHTPKPALVKTKGNLSANGSTLFMLGNGYDAAQGDQQRRNIFKITGWGRKHLFGGNKADIFELTGWRHGKGNADNGKSQFFGGLGEDTLSVRSYFSSRYMQKGVQGVSINLTQGIGDTPYSYGFEVSGIEHLIGSDKNDKFIGNAQSNTLAGYAGDDQLNGNEGDDQLAGGTGNDTVTGGQGSDSYIIQLDDLIEDTSVDIINNFDDHFQKNWQELYDDYFSGGMRLREHKLSYQSDNWQHTLDFQSKHHANHWVSRQSTDKPLQPVEDYLITNLATLTANQSANDLVISVDSRWLDYQRLVKQLHSLVVKNKENKSLAEQVTSKLPKALVTQPNSQLNLNPLIHTLANPTKTNLANNSQLQLLYSYFQQQQANQITVAKVDNYFTGRAYQHLTIVDMLGNKYSFANQPNEQSQLPLAAIQLSEQLGTKTIRLDLATKTISYQNNQGQQQSSMLASHQVNHARGSQNNDLLLGNNKDNWLHGDQGFDTIEGYGGNDTLVAGIGGGYLKGGEGFDTYQIQGNETKVEIDNIATDEKQDTLRFTQGLQNLALQRKGHHLTLAYLATEVQLIDWFTQQKHHLSVSVIDETNHQAGELNFAIVNQTLELQYLNLTYANNTSYKVDLMDGYYQWQHQGRTHTQQLNQLSQTKVFVQMGNGNDWLSTSKGLNHVSGSNGNDTYELTEQDTTLVIENYAEDNKLDTLEWANLRFESLSIKRENNSLLLLNAADRSQQVIVKGWFTGAQYRHLQVKNQQGDTYSSSDLEQLVQAMSSFNDKTQITSTLTNARLSGHHTVNSIVTAQ